MKTLHCWLFPHSRHSLLVREVGFWPITNWKQSHRWRGSVFGSGRPGIITFLDGWTVLHGRSGRHLLSGRRCLVDARLAM